VRTRFAGRSEAELEEMFAELSTFRDTVLANARLRPGDVVADIGAGTGLLTLDASERVGRDGEVLAIDVSVDALEELRANTTAPNISYFVGRADVLPLTDQSVDAVVTRSVLIYVLDKAEAAREFIRVLRPGGRLSLFEPINSRNTRLSALIDFGELQDRLMQWERATYSDPNDPMLNFDESDLERVFRQAGFSDLNVEMRATETRIPPERTLNVVGAPGRLSLLDAWKKRFAPDEVDHLVAAVERAGTIARAWPAVYLWGVKP
jgi:arsenite methyltransferase